MTANKPRCPTCETLTETLPVRVAALTQVVRHFADVVDEICIEEKQNSPDAWLEYFDNV